MPDAKHEWTPRGGNKLLPDNSMPETREVSSPKQLSHQWRWHGTFKDLALNCYRTSYHDMIDGRDMAVKSDLPSGYGGHVAKLSHDVLFDNTCFQTEQTTLHEDPNRERLPDFEYQRLGLPVSTDKPKGAKHFKTYKTINVSGCVPPWAVMDDRASVPDHRTDMDGFMKALSARGPAPPKPEMKGKLRKPTKAHYVGIGMEYAKGSDGYGKRDRTDEAAAHAAFFGGDSPAISGSGTAAAQALKATTPPQPSTPLEDGNGTRRSVQLDVNAVEATPYAPSPKRMTPPIAEPPSKLMQALGPSKEALACQAAAERAATTSGKMFMIPNYRAAHALNQTPRGNGGWKDRTLPGAEQGTRTPRTPRGPLTPRGTPR